MCFSHLEKENKTTAEKKPNHHNIGKSVWCWFTPWHRHKSQIRQLTMHLFYSPSSKKPVPVASKWVPSPCTLSINAFCCHLSGKAHTHSYKDRKEPACFTNMSIPRMYHNVRQPWVTFALALSASFNFLVSLSLIKELSSTLYVTCSARGHTVGE